MWQDRKYFDSGDYAMSKAGKNTTVGSAHPDPSTIPHSHPGNPHSTAIPTSPIKESSNLRPDSEGSPEKKPSS